MKILYFCDATRRSAARSGIHRVIVEAGRELRRFADVEYVVWDEIQGQLRYANRYDLEAVFLDEAFVSTLEVNPYAARVSYRFGDTLSDPEGTWLLFPEIAYHTENGNERYSRLIAQCREYRVKVASILYDIIPITEPGYEDIRVPHVEYVKHLCTSDAILPISRFSGDDLIEWLCREVPTAADPALAMRERIFPIRLGQSREGRLPSTAASRTPDAPLRIISVGTIEPRKQQTRFLRVFNKLAQTHPRLRDARVDLFGSLHPACAAEVAAATSANRNVHHHGYTSDQEIAEFYSTADFSFFLSKSEGFGLPIVESLRFDVPCLCANFGAMAEVAEGGGCEMVDVRSDEEIAAGILRMADPRHLADLRAEARLREVVTWTDYARNVAATLERLDGERAARRDDCVSRLANEGRAVSAGMILRLDEAGRASGEETERDPGMRTVVGLLLDDRPSPATVSRLGDVEVCLAPSTAVRDRVYAMWGEAPGRGMLPARVISTGSTGAGAREELAALVCRRAEEMSRLDSIAAREAFLGELGRRLPSARGKDKPVLSIVISTYNRAPFIRLNLDWLLRITQPFGSDVQIVIVDNDSTDDTLDVVRGHLPSDRLLVHRNNANVGMLGNLNVCSRLELARHVWITGDDDFIQPAVLESVIRTLKADPELPLAVVNFGVYHRFQPSSGDTPEIFAKEAQPLAPNPIPDGRHPLRTVAAQHDNLFTAVYPIIWRSDILAACFNYPFTGVPFVDLVECVPTTKILLESYAATEVAWFSGIGTVGNAHNSWSRHRPRWHGLLMPQVFELARDAGVDPQVLKGWSKIHVELFAEAVEIARSHDLVVHLDPHEFEVSKRVFGIDLNVPPQVRRFAGKNQMLDWWNPDVR